MSQMNFCFFRYLIKTVSKDEVAKIKSMIADYYAVRFNFFVLVFFLQTKNPNLFFFLAKKIISVHYEKQKFASNQTVWVV